MPLLAGLADWPPTPIPTANNARYQDLLINERPFEIFQHGVRSEWGYKAPQQDTFIVVHPKKERDQAPLYVVLHSAANGEVELIQN